VPAVALARNSGCASAAKLRPAHVRGPLRTFNALRHSQARAGDLVAISRYRGLGHLGVQYAAHMGFETVAIARGQAKQRFGGATWRASLHRRTAVKSGDAAATNGWRQRSCSRRDFGQSDGRPSFQASDRRSVADRRCGPTSPRLDATQAIGARQSVRSWASGPAPIGGRHAVQVLTGVRARIETLPLSRAKDALRQDAAR